MSGANKGDFPGPETRFAEAIEELTQSIETGGALEDVRVYSRPKVDVAALRQRYGMTQQQFADAFGIAIGTLRNWEQGRRVPDGPAQRLLEFIEDRPEAAIEVLGRYVVQPSVLSRSAVRERAAPQTAGDDFPTAARQRLAMCYNHMGDLEVVKVDEHVGQRMRQRRWMLGLVQQQLGDSTGVKFQQIQKYEAGVNSISAGRLWDIAAVLQVQVSFFFEGLFVIGPNGQALGAYEPSEDSPSATQAEAG